VIDKESPGFDRKMDMSCRPEHEGLQRASAGAAASGESLFSM
jgi:hypothetical protein